jgi:hypothetical protein
MVRWFLWLALRMPLATRASMGHRRALFTLSTEQVQRELTFFRLEPVNQ